MANYIILWQNTQMQVLSPTVDMTHGFPACTGTVELI